MKLSDYANYLVGKYDNNIDLAMKVAKNDAELAQLEGDTEDFERSTEVFQHLEVIKSSKSA
jgi:hypothetical protein